MAPKEDEQTTKPMNEETNDQKSSCVLRDFVHFAGAAVKGENTGKQGKKPLIPNMKIYEIDKWGKYS